MQENILLKTLDLSGNNIRADGLATLAGALRVSPGVTSLSLKYNNIGTLHHGLRVLCEALKSNTSLAFLDLRNNCIGPDGGSLIGDMLQHNRALTHIDLSWNEIGPVGVKSLLIGLELNLVVVELNLNGTRALEETLQNVDVKLRQNRLNLPPRHPYSKHFLISPCGMSPRGIMPSSTIHPVSPRRDHFPLSSGARLVHDDDVAHKMLEKERTCWTHEDARLLADTAEQIHALQLDVEHHKQQRAQTELKEQTTTACFMDRELEYSNEVRGLAQVNDRVNSEKERLLTETRHLQGELTQKQNEKYRTEQNTVRLQNAARITGDRLRADLQAGLHEKANLEDQIMKLKRCKAEQESENARLRASIGKCKTDLSLALH